jgi:site-specific recombinase XerD
MKQVFIRPLLYKEQEVIGIYFEPDPILQAQLLKGCGARWSRSQRCWWLPLYNLPFEKKAFELKDKVQCINNELEVIIEERGDFKDIANRLPVVTAPELSQDVIIPAPNRDEIRKDLRRHDGIHPVNAHVLPLMRQQISLKAYSPSTLRTYLNEMSQLLQKVGPFSVDALTPGDIKRYLVYCHEKLKLHENTLHSRINALKFYYEQVLKREKFFWEIPRPKKPLQLPKVLGEDELARLFNSLDNLKHKAMLFAAYSAGLRVSEIAALKIRDIDSGRMQIRVENAKGKKDRYVNLSPVLLDILRAYFRTYKPRPVVYLFESGQTGNAYPTRTIQRIFQIAKVKARIMKDVGVHSLRHSFATHMLEKGVDIRYIKDLLGHFNIKTTERYLHVKREILVNIISPLDDLWRTGKIDW